MVMGDIPAADTRLAAMAEIADELRQPTQRRALAVTLTMRALFAGRFEEAGRLIDEALAIGPDGPGHDPVWFWVVHVQAWALAREQGRLEEVVRDIERLVEAHPAVSRLQVVLASLYSELGSGAARERFDALAHNGFKGVAFDSEWLFEISLLSQVCVSLGDEASADILYSLLLPYADHNVLAYPELSLGSAARYLGLLAGALSRWPEAERLFQAAIDANTRMGAQPWARRAERDYAQMLLDRDAAVT